MVGSRRGFIGGVQGSYNLAELGSRPISTTNINLKLHTVRVGLNYRFGWGAVVANY